MRVHLLPVWICLKYVCLKLWVLVSLYICVYIDLHRCAHDIPWSCIHVFVSMCVCVSVCMHTHVHVSHCNPPPGESRKGLWVICELLFDWWANQSRTKDFINNRHPATNQQSSTSTHTHTHTLTYQHLSVYMHTHPTNAQSLIDTCKCIRLPHPLVHMHTERPAVWCCVWISLWHK